MGDSHCDTPEDGELAAPHLIEEQEGWDAGHELADIDHAAQDKRHLVALPEGGKGDGRVVHERVDAFGVD